MKRRDFLKKAVLTTAAAGTALSFGAPAIHAKKVIRAKMVTAWPPNFPVLGESANLFARWVEEMSEGRLNIRVYGGGELIPPFEAFDAVSQGMVEMGHASAYYWAGKVPSAQFFSAVPFGMNAQQMNAWLYAGGGMELWEEVYAPFNLIPMPVGNTGVQMGGWFNREIRSISDIKGLKMRIPGLGGKVIAKAGGTAVLSPSGELYTNLERGVIDATEWIGPYHDFLMGFYRIAKYYYYPGWHEPGTVLELFFNKGFFENLPKNLKTIIRTAAYRSNLWMLSEFESKNNIYLQKLINEHKIKVKRFPEDVLKTFKGYADEVIEELVSKDPMSKKVYDSFIRFKKDVSQWAEVSEVAYHSL